MIFLEYASPKMSFSESRISRKYMMLMIVLHLPMRPGREREAFGPARKKNKCFHVVIRVSRKWIALPVHPHVEAEFNIPIPGFRTN